MVQIQVSGPVHSGKGYVIAAITEALRDLGAEVHVLGEETHLVDLMHAPETTLHEALEGVVIHITQMRTGI